jgi:stage III sporulation protein AG
VGKFQDTWARWFPAAARSQGEGARETGAGMLVTPAAGRGLAVLVLVGAALMWLGRGGGAEKPVAGPPAAVPPDLVATRPEDDRARELTAILSQIAGVGAVAVYISYESGPELVVAEEVSSRRATTAGDRQGQASTDMNETRRPVTLRDDAARVEKPLVLVEKEPQVRGVVVVAEGAASAGVRYELMRAVQTALGVPAHRIAVFAKRI